MPISDSFDFQIVHSVTEIDPESWDRLSAGRPFTSHQWYRYGEAVLADCEPTYLIVHQHGQPIARATFWRVANEPIESAFLRQSIGAMLRRWPVLICRSPLASLPGLVLPESHLGEVVRAKIAIEARELLRQAECSFLVFDNLPREGSLGWPANLIPTPAHDPGTVMKIIWPSFEHYLKAGSKKDRQHYKKTLREAEKLDIRITRHDKVGNVEEALGLIRGVEHRFGSQENPWAQAMLQNIHMVKGTFLAARIGDRLVGCGLVLQDNQAQMNATLGLAKDVPYVYFMLVYESIKIAFDHSIRLLRLGSGAYEVKEQLGFAREDNSNGLFMSQNLFLEILSRLGA